MANNVIVLGSIVEYLSANEPCTRGSHPGCAPNQERFGEERGKGLMQDYFIERSVSNDKQFQTCYRMSPNVFNRIQKMTACLCMLAYGALADDCDEYCRMATSTTIKVLQRFTRRIVALYSCEFLRSPTVADLRRLLAKADRRGFPGMIGSIDCMHWQWKKCPTGWAGEYSGRKRVLTIILEVVASYDTWIWHAFFGVPGACNDLNILAQSPLFDNLTGGRSPKVMFTVNGKNHSLGYYLANGIWGGRLL